MQSRATRSPLPLAGEVDREAVGRGNAPPPTHPRKRGRACYAVPA
jgi:hypothetical protein